MFLALWYVTCIPKAGALSIAWSPLSHLAAPSGEKDHLHHIAG